MKHLPCQFRRRRRTSERNSARRFGSISPSCADQNTTWRAQLIIWKRGSTEPSFQPRLWMCQRSFVGNCSFISAACSREPNLIFNIICRLSLEAGPRGRPDVRAPRVRNLETLPNPLKLLGSVAAVGLVLIKSCCARLTKPDEKVIKTYQSQTAQQIVLSAAAEGKERYGRRSSAASASSTAASSSWTCLAWHEIHSILHLLSWIISKSKDRVCAAQKTPDT